MSQQSDIILAQACTWLSKIHSEQDYDAIAFSDWLIADKKHSEAFNEVRENWQQLSQLKSNVQPLAKVIPIRARAAASSKEHDNTAVDSAKSITKNMTKSIIKNKLAGLTTLAASFVLIVLLQFLPESSQTKHYASNISELKSITLADGSQVILNAKSKLTTQFSDSHRLVLLEQGDGHFIVAKDNKRPFMVKVKQHTFTALGTAFSINTRGQLTILVTEHSVTVKSNDKQQILNEQQAISYLPKADGIMNGKPEWQTMTLTQAKQNMAWQQGKITFNRQPLHQVLTRLSAYLDKPINLMNLKMQDETVTGNFELAKSKEALVMIALGLDLKVKHKAEQILLY